ncbi:MAG TPA: molybdopterin-guanine dinucleotide biosynthesis protein B [Syntrophales bacterium]|nr:molybdopterin-guanine dinucleotide biosynthesis protein B [Syntrophales bacterium]
MIPLLSIVGKSNTGKTTLVEKLIPELTARGYRVATIKHSRHSFDVDREGKDSWRHRKAGARITVLASPHEVVLLESLDHDMTYEEIENRYIRGADIIIAEGRKGNPYPKIEVYRPELHRDLLSAGDETLLAVIAEQPVPAEVPAFRPDDVSALADFLEDRLLCRGKRK